MRLLLLLFCCLRLTQARDLKSHHSRAPSNILLILADDLGYGDTSVPPFVGSNTKTPNLERMARKGTILTNFHTAAATCSPTRASILTGMYPWRVGLKAVYEYGLKGKSNRDDWLPQVLTVATTFNDANYTTIHSGKWHLGGMRNDDLNMRLLPDRGDSVPGSKRCPHPGPNQQGFTHYVSVLDGPGAPRQNYLQKNSQLYSKGCGFLLYNDRAIDSRTSNISGTLTQCEASHAIKLMKDSVKANKPFYTHVWFHSPHGPWEIIREFSSQYQQKLPTDIDSLPLCIEVHTQFCKEQRGGKWTANDGRMGRMRQYRTMVSDMDRGVGMLLDAVSNLGIEQETLIVFLSDNGPEDFAGSSGQFRGNKRAIYEGGIRVPAIFQWTGMIPAGQSLSTFAMSTDLFPTFLEAAHLSKPNYVKLDGMSILESLVGKTNYRKHYEISSKEGPTAIASLESETEMKLTDRVTFWFNDYEGPKRGVVRLFNYKIILDEKELPFEMFDMITDPLEKNNLFKQFEKGLWQEMISKDTFLSAAAKTDIAKHKISATLFHQNQSDSNLCQSVLFRVYKSLREFVLFGDEVYREYLSRNSGRQYQPSIESDGFNHAGRFAEVTNSHSAWSSTGKCSTSCSCKRVEKSDSLEYPFSVVPISRKYLIPNGYLNGTNLLHLELVSSPTNFLTKSSQPSRENRLLLKDWNELSFWEQFVGICRKINIMPNTE